MKQYSSALLLALFAVAKIPSQTEASCSSAQVDNDEDIVSRICDPDEDDRFGTLCDLLRETDIDDTLTTSGDFFLFAPTNTAFNRAGRRVGVTRIQKQNTLRYHISADDSDLECGERRDSLLFASGSQRSSITRCDGNDLQGQQGNVNLPTPGSNYPRFADGDNFIKACNGQIAEIGDVMGWGPVVYDYGHSHGQPCSFYSKSCKGSKGGNYQPKGGNYQPKGAKGARRWSNLNQFQSVYANNYFSPYFQPYYQPYYYQPNFKNGKKDKSNKNQKAGYGGYTRRYYNSGYYPATRRRRGYWYRGRELGGETEAEEPEEGYLRGAAHDYNEDERDLGEEVSYDASSDYDSSE